MTQDNTDNIIIHYTPCRTIDISIASERKRFVHCFLFLCLMWLANSTLYFSQHVHNILTQTQSWTAPHATASALPWQRNIRSWNRRVALACTPQGCRAAGLGTELRTEMIIATGQWGDTQDTMGKHYITLLKTLLMLLREKVCLKGRLSSQKDSSQ